MVWTSKDSQNILEVLFLKRLTAESPFSTLQGFVPHLQAQTLNHTSEPERYKSNTPNALAYELADICPRPPRYEPFLGLLLVRSLQLRFENWLEVSKVMRAWTWGHRHDVWLD